MTGEKGAKGRGKGMAKAVVLALLLATASGTYAAEAKAPERKGGSSDSRLKGEAALEQPKMVVLPFRPDRGEPYDGTGLALHFLMGNVVALHPGLEEFWFGWRVTKIFSEQESLKAYIRGTGPEVDVPRLAAGQDIRFWLRGAVKMKGPSIGVELTLTDARPPGAEWTVRLTADPQEALVGFRKDFLEWLTRCGLGFPKEQADKALWPERTSREGLALLGLALEEMYALSFEKDKGLLRLGAFEQAQRAAPDSYMGLDLLGWADYRNGDYERAGHSFRLAQQLNPDGVGVLAGLMWCAVKTGNAEEAYSWEEKRATARAEPLEPARAAVANRLGNEAYSKKDYARAASLYEKAVAWEPTKRLYVGKLIKSYGKVGQFEQALEAVELALTAFTDPTDRKALLLDKADVLFDRARFLKAAGRYDEAVRSLTEAKAIDSRYRPEKAKQAEKEIEAIRSRDGGSPEALPQTSPDTKPHQ
jgi:tetratricopeptide (TPR) repeat protein